MFPSLRPILNKGGAGRYISRAESAERLVPIAERHLDLLDAYTGALAALPPGLSREYIEAMMSNIRTETAKVSETILSLAGTPPTGAGRPLATAASGTPTMVVQSLFDAEKAFGDALREEVDAVHHQERTRAILGHNAEASDERIKVLRDARAAL